MILLKYTKACFFLAILASFFTSCSPSTGHRASKYSSASKREKNTSKSREKCDYVYGSSKTKKANTSTSTVLAPIRSNIVKSALHLTGTAYKSGGKSPESGFDCSGFTSYIFTQNGLPLSGPSDKLAQMGKQIPQQALKPGDLVFFGNADRISHVAIVSQTNNDQIEVVHATTSAGVKVDEITTSEYWLSRYLFGVDVISK